MRKFFASLIALAYLLATPAPAGFVINSYLLANGNDAYTKILLHFNGADASTTMTDTNIGGSAHTWTVNPAAQLDTAIFKFATAALIMDGSGDFITTPDTVDFTRGSGDFTVDFWFYISTGGNGSIRRIFGQSDAANTVASQSVHGGLTAANVIQGSATSSDDVTQITVTGTTAITTTGFHHYAFVRTGNILRLFLDGIQEGGDVAFTGAINDSADVYGIGRRGSATGLSMFGSVDEFRDSNGIARWTSNFTPPAFEYVP